jgi:endogenous inhibitor of DNA gyrase (YacG/DUF329 family)
VTARPRKPAKEKTAPRCPVCAKPTAREHRPFCSKRCAEVDLGRWLKGGYAVPGEPVTESDLADLASGDIDIGAIDPERE